MENTEKSVSELILLRDRLALDRTVMASERTFLAYVRTALTLVIVGMSFLYIPLFDSAWFAVQGWIFIPLGVGTLVFGLFRLKSMQRKLGAIRDRWSASA